MIDSLVLATDITVFQALKLKKRLGLPVIKRDEAKTREYACYGIRSFGIWLNLDKILEEPEVKNCTLSAIVDGKRFYQNDRFDVRKVLSVLDSITKKEGLSEINWKIQNISLRRNVQSDYPAKYMELINNGYSLKWIGVKKTADNKAKPQNLKYESDSISLRIEADDMKKTIGFSLRLQKRKLNDMVRGNKYSIEDRAFVNYEGLLEGLEYKLWICYLGGITGMADYYSFKEAERIINTSDKKRVEKENMYSVLKGVAVYKGVEEYLSHVEDIEKKYDFMNCIRTQRTAKAYIKMLQDDLGINPVNISRRDAKELKLNHLKNLLLYKELPIKEYGEVKMQDDWIASATPAILSCQDMDGESKQAEQKKVDDMYFNTCNISGDVSPF